MLQFIGLHTKAGLLVVTPIFHHIYEVFMFHVSTHLEKKAALEKYADSLNKIIHDHLEQNPNTSPREILLHHARNCDLENCGEDEPVTKRKRLSDGATTKQTTKRQKRTPLLERNQNLGTAEVKSVSAQNQKKAVKAREESSIKAMQQMHTSMAVSKNFLSYFPSTTQSSAHMQVRKMSSEITAPLVVTGLQTPTARPDNIQQENAITQLPGQYQARERTEVTNPLIVTGLQTPTARPSSIPQGETIAQRPSQYQPSERSVVGTSITELPTPTAPLNNKQQENAICQRPRQYQARGRSPERVQLSVAEREDSSPLSSLEAIAEATSMPESDVVAPPSTKVLPTTPRGMPYSDSVNNGSASYDMWRSSMTALLDMEADEFEQMSNLASDHKNADHDLYEENQALRKENQQLKEQLMKIRQQNDFSHPGK